MAIARCSIASSPSHHRHRVMASSLSHHHPTSPVKATQPTIAPSYHRFVGRWGDRWYYGNGAMMRWLNKALRHSHRAIELSPSCHRIMVTAPSRNRHRAIAPWCHCHRTIAFAPSHHRP